MHTLLWKEKKSSISDMLQELTISGSYTDVTFVFDDQSQINSHKMVIAALSPVFKELLNSIDDCDDKQIIYIEGFSFQNFELLLEFMYLGEVTLAKREQDMELLEIAKFFQVEYFKKKRHGMLFLNENYEYFEPKDENFKLEEVHDVQEIHVTGDISIAQETESAFSSRKFSCDQCQYRCNYKKNLKPHIERHHEGVVYSCEECDFKAKSKTSLKYHDKSKHNHEGFQYSCNQCDYKTYKHTHLTVHVEAKHERLKHSCSQCEFKATNKNNLKIHIKSKHENVKYECKICDYKGNRPSNLHYHISSKHKGIRFECNKCDFTSSTKYNLNNHAQTIHEGLKYSCDQCDYQANHKSLLRRHIKI